METISIDINPNGRYCGSCVLLTSKLLMIKVFICSANCAYLKAEYVVGYEKKHVYDEGGVLPLRQDSCVSGKIRLRKAKHVGLG